LKSRQISPSTSCPCLRAAIGTLFSRQSVTAPSPTSPHCSTITVGTNTFQWSLPAGPSATIRYSLTFTTDTWHEIGEITADGGTTWHQNFQMDLLRIH